MSCCCHYLFVLINFYCNLLLLSSGRNFYKSLNPSISVTTQLFDRLLYYEEIFITHTQFHSIDNGNKAIYPMNGKIEFNAFGNYYKLLIRKNVELFSNDFYSQKKIFNKNKNKYDIHKSYKKPDCYYTAEVVSDKLSASRGVFSACRGRGIRGWIHAFNETVVIRPKLYLTNVNYTGKYSIDNKHIIYKYNDLNRNDYEHNFGPTCGHDHPLTESLLNKHNHHHITDGYNSNNDIIAKPFSNHARDIGKNLINNLKTKTKKRRKLLQTEAVRYVELAIVNDPGMLLEYCSNPNSCTENEYQTIEDKTVSIVSTLQSYYLNTDWGDDVGSIQIVLSAIYYEPSFTTTNDDTLISQPSFKQISGSSTTSCSNPVLYSSSNNNECEVDYGSYLSNFQDYRQENLNNYDNAQLFSYYDFLSSVIGYASLPGMCISSSSGGIEQCTYDDEYNGNIVAHEMGHNFDMQHDGNGNNCDASDYIMASSGSPQGNRPDSFSDCSINYVQEFFDDYASNLQKLDNKPIETSFAVCRNGFVESGESCDCGQSDCSGIDDCCDGEICALYATAQCANDDICCEDCQIKSAGSVCRELNLNNPCDIEEETCNGELSECPPDTKFVEGTECLFDGDTYPGMCYSGNCISVEEQCDAVSLQTGNAYEIAPSDVCGWSPPWKVPSNRCDNEIKCSLNNNCYELSGADIEQGTPCNITGTTDNLPRQCHDNICSLSSDIYTYLWTVNPWQDCNITCRNEDDDEAGYQMRTVQCTFQNGTEVNNDDFTKCSIDDEPISSRKCNDYVCNFCADQSDGSTVCGDHGTCEEDLGICDCESGYDGTYCDIAPALNFTGVVSQALPKNITGHTISYRANPCFNTNDSILPSYDVGSKTLTIPVDTVSSLTDIYLGSTLGLRWVTGGDIEFLAVGMIEVDVDGNKLDENDWAFYVGTSLATNEELCDDYNSTTYDECLWDLSCNDFTFIVPTNLNTPSYYKIIVRFNNDFNIESNVLNVYCSESNCNSVGHGECNIDGTSCECDDGWHGDSCSYSICDEWSFAICDVDQDGNCGSLGATEWKPKCFGGDICDSSVNITNNYGDQCEKNTELTCINDLNFEGTYCEIPIDYCGTIELEAECDSGTFSTYPCIWADDLNNNNGKCVYDECYQFKTYDECSTNNNTNDTSSSLYFIDSLTWPQFCEWNGEYCSRVTCSDGILPDCENGAVRRPLYDEYSTLPRSICYGWYCDCSTIQIDQEQQMYWDVKPTSTLDSNILPTYNYNITSGPLTSDYVSDIDLFTCSSCGLESDCSNGATVDSTCSNCYSGCPTEISPFRAGIKCNQAFWIANFRINIDWDTVFVDKPDEFSSLFLTDLAYFLNTDIKHLSIWQIKPDNGGSVIYFRYLFDTDNDDETQVIGGDVMIFASNSLLDPTSTASRGFLMQYTDFEYAFEFCIPTKEECDPTKSFDFLIICVYCLAGSFLFEILCVIMYRIGTRGRRQRQYEEKVREVRQAQLRLMEHHSKARRVGMRDVSKNRAHKIHSAKKKKEKDQQKEMKIREEKEKKLNKINEDLSYKGSAADKDNKWLPVDNDNDNDNISQHSHNIQSSEMELEQYRKYSAQQDNHQQQPGYQAPSHHGSVAGSQRNRVNTRSSRAASFQSNDPSTLPSGWKQYYNDDGVPYYYNTINGQTTWRHPNDPNAGQ